MDGEITFDTVLHEDDQDHIEGCYRLANGEWKVYYLTHRHNGEIWTGDPIIKKDAIWQSGITGVNAIFPKSTRLNRISTMLILSSALGGINWTEVNGPNSLVLK